MRTPTQAVEDPAIITVPSEASRETTGDGTLPDSFLLGARNDWADLLEECWPDIGWELTCMRRDGNGTLEDIPKLFEPASRNAHDRGLAAPLYRQSSEVSDPAEVQKTAEQLGKCDAEIIQLQARHDQHLTLCRDAEAALKVADPGDLETIRVEAERRTQRFRDLEASLQKRKAERDALEVKLADKSAYVYRLELMAFLRSHEFVLNPRNLANALAGLPRMTWKQSFDRCSEMPFNHPRFEYSAFKAISEVWGNQPEQSQELPLDFFRTRVLGLSEEFGYTQQFLFDNWSDLRRAIQECWKSRRAPGSIPFVLTSLFMRMVTQPKNAAERILAEREKLEA
jgi:hypothetical protein